MELVKDIALYVCVFFFIVGLLSTAFNGSINTAKKCLIVLAVIFSFLSLAGLVLSGGLLIFLIPQLIVLYILIAIFVVLGASLGVYIDKLKKDKASGINLTELEDADYISLSEFANSMGVQEERIIKRIKSGFYKGGTYQNDWYVHKSELEEVS